MYMPFDMVQLSLIFARGTRDGKIASRVAGGVSRWGRQGRRQSQSSGLAGSPAKSASGVSQQGQSPGGAQKASARAAVSRLSTAAVVVAALMAVFCVWNRPRKRSRSVF